MSVRIYTGPHSDRGGPPTGWIPYLPWGLAFATILGQILWVLVSGTPRVVITVLTVITFFLASVTHAYVSRGLAWAASYTGITLAFGWAIEFLGITTQFPFGDYQYESLLGPGIAGVPLVIPMAWSMMAYPCLLAAERLSTTYLGTAVLGGILLASWDLFLDPQMVGEGYWTWADTGWALPGIPGIPLQNFLGWLLASVVLMALLSRLPRKVAHDGVPTMMLIWTFASNVLAAPVFFGRPGVAVWGLVCMGAVMVPWMWRIWSEPQW